MTRKKTNPFVAHHLLAKIEKVNMKEEKETIVTWSRASSILPKMVLAIQSRFIMERNIYLFI